MLPFLRDNRVPLRKNLQATVENVGASKEAKIIFDTGPTYRALMIKPTIASAAPTRAQLETMLTNWQLELSGDDLFNMSGLLLYAICEFYQTGIIGDLGYVVIPFDRNWNKDIAGVRGPGLGTVGETSFTLRIVQDATSTIDAITALGAIDPKPAIAGKHTRYARLTPPIPAADAEIDWNGLKKLEPGDQLFALHVQVSTVADLTYLTYMADSVKLFDKTSVADLKAWYRQQSPTRTLQDGKKVISFDFTMDGWSDGVPMNMVTQTVQYLFDNVPTTLIVVQEYGTQKLTPAAQQYLQTPEGQAFLAAAGAG